MAASPRALSQVYVGQGIFWTRIDADGTVDDRMAGIRKAFEATGGKVIEVTGPTEILPGVWLTGPVPRIHAERNWGSLGKVRRDGKDVEDTVPEDMALVFQTDRGLVHVRRAIDPGPVKAVIGGLHLYLNDDQGLSWTAGQLKRFGLQQLVGTHCTGLEAVFRIRDLAGLTRQACVVGAVGASYSLTNGINPLRVAK
jgi:7,8-dihydropterin-6-yl-methyl-4-(beta-D-ribofuranosyl)aminobenzene 5'-phosphate synthase